MIVQSDSLEWLKKQADLSADIIFADPPYALGSTVIIKGNGKPDYKKAVDFMSKWEMPNGEYWEQWFKEAFRVLKHGGRCLLFSIDRQSFLFRYYACLGGLEATQNLYWYFISNFPKSADLSKNIDKNLGAEREVVNIKKVPNIKGDAFSIQNDKQKTSYENINVDITKSNSELGKKYEGIKYSISPLKQTLEEIMVFNKPTKTGSVLHDVIAYENGDKTIAVNAWNIDNGRVDFKSEKDKKTSLVGFKAGEKQNSNINLLGSKLIKANNIEELPDGRYPSQLFVDSAAAEILDEQSGEKKGSASGYNFENSNQGNVPITNNIKSGIHFDDIGGCSKILHKCDFAVNEFYLLNYCPKTSNFERNAGCGEFEPTPKSLTNSTMTHNPNEMRCKKCNKRPNTVGNENNSCCCVEPEFDWYKQKNSHPTLKPIKLIYQIAKLLKMPVNQKVLFPFAGSGSEIIGFLKAGFTDVKGCEINQEYINIANARIKYWQSVNFNLEYKQTEFEKLQKDIQPELF